MKVALFLSFFVLAYNVLLTKLFLVNNTIIC